MKRMGALGLIILLFRAPLCASEQQNPFTKISITSNRATCMKDKTNSHLFVFHYLENVIVLFADGSKVTSDVLEIVFNSKKAPSQDKKNFLSKFKKITFKNNVHIISQNRQAWADKAELYPITQECKLAGNIKIQQQKEKEKDVPISIESEQAILNLKTKEVSLFGSTLSPVCTVIELGQHIQLAKKDSAPVTSSPTKQDLHEQNKTASA